MAQLSSLQSCLLLPVIIIVLFSQSVVALPIEDNNSVHQNQNIEQDHHHHLHLGSPSLPASLSLSKALRSRSARPKSVPPSFETSSQHAQFRLKSVVPVDLYNPCSMEEENWSETYLFDSIENVNKEEIKLPPLLDEKYSLEHGALSSELSPSDDITNHEGGGDEDDGSHAKVITQLTALVGHRDRFGLDLLKEMLEKAAHLQGLVTDMIRKHLIPECQHLELPTIMEIPKHNATNPNLVTSLSGIYQTLANQTAHLYLIWRQQRKQSARRNGCNQHGQVVAQHLLKISKNNSSTVTNLTTSQVLQPKVSNASSKRMHARRVADDFLIVSSNLRGLMCHFKQAFSFFGLQVPTRQIVTEVLEHTFTGSLSCSRMSVVDCQLMKSSVQIFADIEAFLRLNSGRFFTSESSTSTTSPTTTPKHSEVSNILKKRRKIRPIHLPN